MQMGTDGLIEDDVLYPKGQRPYSPLELHIRLALFVVGLLKELPHSPTSFPVGRTSRPDHYCGPYYLVKERMVATAVVSTSYLRNYIWLRGSCSFWTMNRLSGTVAILTRESD